MSEYNAEPIQKIIMAHCSSTMSMDRCRNLGNDIAELVAAETDQLRQRVAELKAASPRTEPLDNNTTRYTFEHGVLEASYVAGAATVVVRK